MTDAALAMDTFGVFGTTAVLLVTEPAALPLARALADAELAAVDLACSRFRPDSELSRLNGSNGKLTVVSELFAELIAVALRAADLTDGHVDPTCGQALAAAGYDRDFTELNQRPPGQRPVADFLGPGNGAQPAAIDPAHPVGAVDPAHPADPVGAATVGRPVPGWRHILLDPDRLLVRLDHGAQLDLGATAKAWAADHCAELIATRLDCGVLVSLGGDIAVAGPAPPDGWQVRVTDDHAAPIDAPGQTVAIRSGGLATSSTTVRTWTTADRRMNHIIDPATGQPTQSCWRTVSVAAGTCVDANIASTASIIRGEAAVPWLADAGLPARLVTHDGRSVTTAGWPAG